MKIFGFGRHVLVLSGLCSALICGTGCAGLSHGSSSQPPASTTYVYVAAQGNQAISQFQVASDGTLTPLSPATIADTAGYGPVFLATDPAEKFLFASGLVSPPVIAQFVIGSGGTITANTNATVNGGDSAYPFVFTPNGQFAIVPDIGSNTLSTYSLDATGNLTLASTATTCNTPTAPAVDPAGQYVYISCIGGGSWSTILEYSISSGGVLTPLTPNNSVLAGDEVIYLAVSPKGFLYAANYHDGTVTAFAINESTGTLANAGSFPSGVGPSSGPNWIAFDPTGAYAYVTNNYDNTVSQFDVNPTTGALSMSAPDVPTDSWPAQIAVDPSGRFAYTVNNGPGTISLFTIGSAGTLTPNGSLTVAAQSGMAITMVQQ